MYQFLPENSGDLVALKTSGKLDEQDLNALLPSVEERIRQHGKIRFLWEMSDFGGWTPLSFFRDRLFELKHAADYTRIALVGEKKWEEGLAAFMKVFTPGRLRYFDRSEREQAVAWVKGA